MKQHEQLPDRTGETCLAGRECCTTSECHSCESRYLQTYSFNQKRDSRFHGNDKMLVLQYSEQAGIFFYVSIDFLLIKDVIPLSVDYEQLLFLDDSLIPLNIFLLLQVMVNVFHCLTMTPTL
jgi:hypothetical protein